MTFRGDLNTLRHVFHMSPVTLIIGFVTIVGLTLWARAQDNTTVVESKAISGVGVSIATVTPANPVVVMASPSFTATPTVEPTKEVAVILAAPELTVLPDRTSCSEIRGTDYRSEAEQAWFSQNCNPTPVPQATQAVVAAGSAVSASPTQTVNRPSVATATPGTLVLGPVSDSSVSLESIEAQIMSLTNQNRGANPLVVDYQLVAAARVRSQEMVANGFGYGHSDGNHIHQVIRSQGVSPQNVGENISGTARSSSSAANVVQNFLNSPSHRTTMLDTSFKRIGVGVAVNPNGSLMVTMLLMAP